MNRRHCLTVLASAIALGGTSLASAQVKEAYLGQHAEVAA